MADKRIAVWVQRFKDRPHLVLQWTDPATNKRKSKSAGTADAAEAEDARADHEYELNHGRYQEASRMSWERFRELFEAEFVAGLRPNTRANYASMLDLFGRVCNPRSLKGITTRTVSAFVAGLRKEPGRARGSTMMASSIKVRLQFLHTALSWAVSQKLLPELPDFPGVKVPAKSPQPVPAESFEKLLAKARDPEMKAFLLCGWLAGLRRTEALELQREQTETAPYLDPDRNRIVLPAEFCKAVKDQWVPLDPELRAVLDALPRHGRKVFRFLNRCGQVKDGRALSGDVARLAKKAGVRLTMKSLRRGFGCRYAGKVSAHVLQRLMRHANIAITMAYYANIDDAVDEAVLGAKRNNPRNSGGSPVEGQRPANDAKPSAASSSAAAAD